MSRSIWCGVSALLLLSACSGGRDDTLDCKDGARCAEIDEGDATVERDAGDAGGAQLDASADAEVDAQADASADATRDDAEVVSCAPDSRRCTTDTRLAVCLQSGDGYNELDCPTGCDETGGVAACRAADLSAAAGWSVVPFPLSDDAQSQTVMFQISEGGLVATQVFNGNPGIYLHDRVFERVIITGRFSVETSGDDDMIGFVFGYQDDAHFYLLDWKQLMQDAPPCGFAPTGVTLKRIQAPAKPNLCRDFWGSADTDNLHVLSPASENPTGWIDPTADMTTVYEFTLRHAPGSIDIEIRTGDTLVASVHSDDATYARGQFGFYNYSQSAVRYEGFRFEPLP